MSYLKNILIGIDQLGNTIAGGNPDCTISGRIGYYANHAISVTRWYWIAMQAIVNFTFYPLDGLEHCYYAYQNEEDENYIAPKGVLIFILSFITIGSCFILAPLHYVLWFFKIVKPKNNNRM
jgi:hypothetical protein